MKFLEKLIPNNPVIIACWIMILLVCSVKAIGHLASYIYVARGQYYGKVLSFEVHGRFYKSCEVRIKTESSIMSDSVRSCSSQDLNICQWLADLGPSSKIDITYKTSLGQSLKQNTKCSIVDLWSY